MARAGLLIVAGARPNFMKIAPVATALRSDGRFESTIVHTGQHYDRKMSDLFFEQLGIPEPGVRLGVGSGSHAQQTAEIMARFEPVVLEHRPNAVVVVGDVNSTIAASLVAVKLGVPVAHIEAGLRSFDRTMPEEINRVLTDSISEWLFVTEPSGVENLQREGVAPSRVHRVGNVMIDTLLQCRDAARALDVPAAHGLEPGGYAVLTMHRPANVDAAATLRAMLEPIVEMSAEVPVVFPVHPRTRKNLEDAGLRNDDRVRLVDPLGYLEFLGLMESARVVLTDSGGIQEETTVLGVPCVTLRENTERPVTVEQGTNHLAGVTPEGIRAAIAQVLSAPPEGRVPDLWDGKAAERIVAVLARDLVN